MTTATRTMLLIDADNVSMDVVEQAVMHLLADHGALHVRRAYCTAESAAKHQAAFKRLGIRPMVNLAAGKNSTDIALAVDAIDLVQTGGHGLVAIASSDSDFAPLVARLREKGWRVIGIGQDGKTGDETRAVYDAFTDFTHRRARSAPASAPAASAKKPARRTAAPAPPAAGTRRTGRKAASGSRAPAAPTAPADAPALPDKVAAILAALPALAAGEAVALRQASERLRAAGVLSRSASLTRLFRAHPEHFVLDPEAQPQRVRRR